MIISTQWHITGCNLYKRQDQSDFQKWYVKWKHFFESSKKRITIYKINCGNVKILNFNFILYNLFKMYFVQSYEREKFNLHQDIKNLKT